MDRYGWLLFAALIAVAIALIWLMRVLANSPGTGEAITQRLKSLTSTAKTTAHHTATASTLGNWWDAWKGKLLMLAGVGVMLLGGLQWPPGHISLTDIALGLTWMYCGARLDRG